MSVHVYCDGDRSSGDYQAHRAAGGAADAVQEQILAEVAAEDVSVLVANPGAGGVH